MMFGRGFGNGCPGFGFAGGNPWYMFIHLGIIIVAMVAVIYFVRRINKTRSNNSAIETLKLKFVNGEISEEEYLQKKSILGKM